jgi:hypothetical protein
MDRRKHDGTLCVGSRSGSIYIQGMVYHLIYLPDQPRRRLVPEDVRRIPWHALEEVFRTAFDETTHRATAMRLRFSVDFRFQHWLFYTNSVYLTQSTRNATVHRIRPAVERRAELVAAFLAGAHPRLGHNSIVRCLQDDTLRAVVAFM